MMWSSEWGIAYPSCYMFLSKEDVERSLKIVYEKFDYYMEQATKQKICFEKTPERLNGCYMREGGRFDMVLIEELQFLRDTARQKWLSWVQQIFQSDFELAYMGCVMSIPGNLDQNWHIDGMHLHKINHERADKIVVFVPLISLTKETGCTEMKPRSHIRHGRGTKFDEYGAMSSRCVYAEAGQPIIMDYRLWHRGLANNSNKKRPLLYFKYQKKSLVAVSSKKRKRISLQSVA